MKNQIENKILFFGSNSEDTSLTKKEVRSTNTGSLISFFFGAVSVLCLYSFKVFGNDTVWIPLAGTLAYLLTFVFNFFQWRSLAKVNIWLVSMFIFFWMASAFGYESNSHLLFIVIILGTLFNYNPEEKRKIILLISLPIALIVLLFITRFSLFYIPGIGAEEKYLMGVLNLFSSIAGSIASIISFIKENKEKADLIKKSEREIRKQYEELKKTNSELDLLVYSVTHDLRAPITSAIALVDICDVERDNLSYYLSLQKRSLVRLDKFVMDILHYYRNSRMEVKPVEIDLERTILECYELQEHAKENVTIQKTIECEVSSPFFSDDLRINILINNLISNAIRYADVQSDIPYVHTKVTVNKEVAVIQVIDNGIGIEESHFPKIYNMFYRATKTSTGSGLGLYIVKEIIHKLSGSISMTSEPGVGTTFTVTVPNLYTKQKKVGFKRTP
ncbi:MAG: GHKL domain-containing protein [Bacteroidia bacterium]|nr:GHKL domain-containing protein [Bacteroidia bacterium]